MSNRLFLQTGKLRHRAVRDLPRGRLHSECAELEQAPTLRTANWGRTKIFWATAVCQRGVLSCHPQNCPTAHSLVPSIYGRGNRGTAAYKLAPRHRWAPRGRAGVDVVMGSLQPSTRAQPPSRAQAGAPRGPGPAPARLPLPSHEPALCYLPVAVTTNTTSRLAWNRSPGGWRSEIKVRGAAPCLMAPGEDPGLFQLLVALGVPRRLAAPLRSPPPLSRGLLPCVSLSVSPLLTRTPALLRPAGSHLY